MKKITLIIVAIFIGLCSCKKGLIKGMIIKDNGFALELRASPEKLLIGNNTLVLSTYLWRDFMPIAEENGSKMICINHLTEVDSIPILSTIKLKKQFVIKGNEIWKANYGEVNNYGTYKLEGVVRNGPKWGPDIEVDVVCEFENSGVTYRILAKSQLIDKTF